MSPPSQAKVHRALLLGVLTDARHVFTPVRNLYATFLHVSFRLLVSNQGGLREASLSVSLALRMSQKLHIMPHFRHKKRHPRNTSVLKSL